MRGSDKQIKWAEQIKAGFVARFAYIAEHTTNPELKVAVRNLADAMNQDGIHAVRFIDNRESVYEFIRACAQSANVRLARAGAEVIPFISVPSSVPDSFQYWSRQFNNQEHVLNAYAEGRQNSLPARLIDEAKRRGIWRG